MPDIYSSMPAITDVLARMGGYRNYPHVFSGAKSAVVFFCAAFYGVNDAIYYYEYKMKDVTVVDIDKEKMEWMKRIYPEEWNYVTADAFGYAGKLLRAGESFDVVSCDPFTNVVPRVLIDEFDKFYGLAKKYLVARVSYGNFFEKYEVGPTAEGLQKFLTEEHGPIKVRELNQVSTFDGGCYWAVIEK